MFKTFVRRRLEHYVKRYFKKHPQVKLVIVAGSVGKTYTKLAIGTVLSQRYRIRMHEGNHNSDVSAPLAMLGIDFPESLRSIKAWMIVFKAARKRIRDAADVDVVIQEVGSDGVGQVPHFGTYATPDLAVITAVSPEHMHQFKTIGAVAAEELSAANFSKAALINRDDIEGIYAQDITNPNINTYGTTDTAEYHFVVDDQSFENGYSGSFKAPEWEEPVGASIKIVGDHTLRSAVAAGAVGVKLGLTLPEVQKGLKSIRPYKGRMNTLRGVNQSIILDDSYNSSPLAAAAALQTLYQISVPQRIAVFGSMNELGVMSQEAHETLGKMCDPNQLAHVVTVGEEAEKYLAPAARSNGCHVVSFKTALDAGAFVHKSLEPGAVILFKGSQDNIYLEEAIKIVLHSTDEEEQLVRQSPEWLELKQKYFAQYY